MTENPALTELTLKHGRQAINKNIQERDLCSSIHEEHSNPRGQEMQMPWDSNMLNMFTMNKDISLISMEVVGTYIWKLAQSKTIIAPIFYSKYTEKKIEKFCQDNGLTWFTFWQVCSVLCEP